MSNLKQNEGQIDQLIHPIAQPAIPQAQAKPNAQVSSQLPGNYPPIQSNERVHNLPNNGRINLDCHQNQSSESLYNGSDNNKDKDKDTECKYNRDVCNDNCPCKSLIRKFFAIYNSKKVRAVVAVGLVIVTGLIARKIYNKANTSFNNKLQSEFKKGYNQGITVGHDNGWTSGYEKGFCNANGITSQWDIDAFNRYDDKYYRYDDHNKPSPYNLFK